MLSPVEEKLIRDSWDEISSDLKGNGAKIFIQFFTDYPKYQKNFKSFANIPIEDLSKNKRFMVHAFTVISAVDGMVQNIDDPEMLDEMLLKTGINHGKRHKIAAEAFDEFKISFMKFLEIELSSKWVEVEKVWDAVVSLIISKIKDGLEQDD